MGEEIQEWQYLWGAKVKMPIDVPDDILKDGVNTVRAKLEVCVLPNAPHRLRYALAPCPCFALRTLSRQSHTALNHLSHHRFCFVI